ncbi:MAG TPA: NTP transferase domain-containing protein [Steroidobacteraceae bacterium]|jgi:molybdopterin-guanine dinucleotide biosynthesis protein A|nr:NTP transferase domain-containing protein [Steroidobacteraceae bacterium]
MTDPRLFGLVLSGGHSRRMQRDKAGLEYAGRPQLARAMDLLQPLVARAFVSVRADQRDERTRAGYDSIADIHAELGPLGGIHAALTTHPAHAWLVLACDLPFLDAATLQHLIAHRARARLVTAYRSSSDGLPEPLCAIFEPSARAPIEHWIAQGQKCPRKLLSQSDVELLDLPNAHALDNINTVEEYSVAHAALGCARRLNVRYFAMLREQAGCSFEQLQTRAVTPADLYEELRQRHGLTLKPQFLRVAVNDEFGDWNLTLADGDTVVFLPPVAGG